MELHSGQNLLFDKMRFSDSIRYYIRQLEIPISIKGRYDYVSCEQKPELATSTKDFLY
jgi:hypothetical protein